MIYRSQLGRSMIEMLGVLAVIGLLSVGGIAGYSKAMMNYKISKTIEQINEISARISAYGDQLSSYSGLNNYTAVRANLMPSGASYKKCGKEKSSTLTLSSELLPLSGKEKSSTLTLSSELLPLSGNNCNVINQFGGQIIVGAMNLNNSSTINDEMAYGILYTGIPEEACLSLTTHDWARGINSSLVGLAVNKLPLSTGGNDSLFLGCKGSGDHYACIHDIPVSPANAVKWCSPGDNNKLLLKYF